MKGSALMDKAALGKRIKEARLAKKMTQAEVVGDFITRNMLSQIESGLASPSVKTLEYLSRVLEVPLDSLMPSPDEQESEADDLSLYAEIKRDYSEGDYLKIINADNFPKAFEDECSALKAASSFETAKKLSECDDVSSLQKAVDLARSAAELADEGIFANKAVKTSALLLLDELAGRLADYYKGLISGGSKV